MALLAHWLLNETGNTFVDVSGNGFDFDVSAFGSSDISKGYTVNGRTGAYMHLRSAGDVCPKVTTSDVRLNLNDDWTISAYLLWPSTRFANWPRVATYGDFPGILTFGGATSDFDTSPGWMFFYSEYGEPFQMYTSATDPRAPIIKRNGVSYVDGAKINEDIWYNTAITYTAATSMVATYRNGVAVGSLNYAFPDSSDSILRLGSNPNYGYHQKARCVISDLQVWSEVVVPAAPGAVTPPLRQRQKLINTPRMRQAVR